MAAAASGVASGTTNARPTAYCAMKPLFSRRRPRTLSGTSRIELRHQALGREPGDRVRHAALAGDARLEGGHERPQRLAVVLVRARRDLDVVAALREGGPAGQHLAGGADALDGRALVAVRDEEAPRAVRVAHLRDVDHELVARRRSRTSRPS